MDELEEARREIVMLRDVLQMARDYISGNLIVNAVVNYPHQPEITLGQAMDAALQQAKAKEA